MKKLMALRLLAAAALLAPVQAIAQQAQQVPVPPPYYYGYGPWHMWGMFPLALLFFILICGVMFLFMRGAFGMGGHFAGGHWQMTGRDATRSALEILNERYARGEIQKEEYLEKKATLLSRG